MKNLPARLPPWSAKAVNDVGRVCCNADSVSGTAWIKCAALWCDVRDGRHEGARAAISASTVATRSIAVIAVAAI